MPKKQRSIKYRDEVKAAVYRMSNTEAANSLRAAQMAEENARAKAAAARARAAAARAEARAEARAAAAERRRPDLEKDLEDKFGNYEHVYNDLRSRDPDMTLTLSEMTPGFQQLLHPEKSKAAIALRKLEGLPSGKSWLSSNIRKRPYRASKTYRNNPGSTSKDAHGRKLYKTRNKKSRRGRQGKRTRRARISRRARRTRRARK